MAKTDPLSMTALIGSAVEADPEIAARVRRLITVLIEQAEWTMKWGSPSDKSLLMRATVPAMMKALQKTEEDEQSRAQREAISRIYTSLSAGKT